MISYKGTSYQDWKNTLAHDVKFLVKKYNSYQKEHKDDLVSCPLLR